MKAAASAVYLKKISESGSVAGKAVLYLSLKFCNVFFFSLYIRRILADEFVFFLFYFLLLFSFMSCALLEVLC
jgi:hypothetical protein